MACFFHFPGFMLCILLMFGCNTGDQYNTEKEPVLIVENREVDGPERPNSIDFNKKVAQASIYCRQNGLDTKAAILIDLGLHSGKYRCFVVNFTDGVIQAKGLVTHGSGHTGLSMGERQYSNKNGAYLSALGRYKTGIKYHGQFGLAYKLHGLDPSNSNAFERSIVLHGHECVPDYEMNNMVCQSWGCPTVSPAFLKKLQKIIDRAEKPVLLWIYDSVTGSP